MSDFSVLWTVLGIGLLIFVHELGHYIAARCAGVRVEVFSLGFGTRLIGWQIGATDYRISMVPLGGYVKVAGDDPTDRRFLAPDDLHAKGFVARAFFFSGGVLMNFLFALIVFPIVFKSGVEFTAPVLGAIAPGGAAWEGDLRPGDRIVAVDGKRMYSYENFRVEVALSGGDEVTFEIERAGQRFERTLRPHWSSTEGVYGIEAMPALDLGPVRLTVESGSPANAAGLRTNDVLTAIDGVTIEPKSLEARLIELTRGTPKPLRIGVLRDGKPLEITYLPDAKPLGDPRIGVSRAARRVRSLRPPALGAIDLRSGDRILEIDGQPFFGPDLTSTSADGSDKSDKIALLVDREGRTSPVRIEYAFTNVTRAEFLAGIAIGEDGRGLTIVPTAGLPADRAGLRAGDTVTAIEGVAVSEWKDLQRAVRGAGTTPVRVTYDRAGKVATTTVTPARDQFSLGFDVRAMHRPELYRVDGVLDATVAGFVCSLDLVKQLYVTLKRLFTGDVAASNLGGIIQISVVTHEFAKSGWARFFYFLALLSINLAFMNFLPIPVLDGGHMLFLIIEKVKGSPVSPRTLGYAQIAGLVFLIALMLFVTYNDIRKHF